MADINDLKDICISSGTLRAEDLLPRFMGILKDYAPEKFNEFIKGFPELDGWEDFLEADWRIISDDTKMNASDELFGLLNDIAPEGTMFSSTEGDGADFGFWSVEEKKEESKDITTLTDLKKFILSKNDNSVVFGVNSTGDLYFVDSVNGKEVPASADSLAVAEDDSDEHGKRIGNQGTGYFVVWKNCKRPTYMTAQQIYDELLKIARSWTVEEKLLDDDEGEKALKQMAKDGKSTGEVAADIRYDVATALDMAADKAEDLMSKFGLDNIYVLRAKGLSPKAIAKKILKADGGKSEAKKYYGYGKDDAIDKEDNDFMWQVAYDWFVDKLPEKLARYADKAVTDVIDKDSRAYEEIVTMDDYYDYLETYGPVVIEEITGDLAESKKTESSGVGLSSIYGDGDVSMHENSADGFYVNEHDPMGFAVLNNDTATMKKLFSGKAVAPEKPWTYAGWHEDTDAPENKDGSYPYIYDWEREYDLNFVNDWKRIVGDKDNEKALELLLKYAPDFIPSAMDFWNAFHAGYSKGLLRKLFDNIFAVVDKDDPYNNYLGYGDYTYDEVAKFLEGKGESKNEDLNTAKDFVYSIAPIAILVRQASQPGFKGVKNSDDHIIVGFMRHDNTRFIIDWDADKKQGTATRQVMVDDKDSQYGYKWVTPKSNANVTFTTREELKDFVEGSWDNTSSESKNESLTLKQKELKDMARYGEAEDITTISDAEAKELKKKGIETVGVSRGTYGMNGALLRDREGNKYVITARSSNLFYFV